MSNHHLDTRSYCLLDRHGLAPPNQNRSSLAPFLTSCAGRRALRHFDAIIVPGLDHWLSSLQSARRAEMRNATSLPTLPVVRNLTHHLTAVQYMLRDGPFPPPPPFGCAYCALAIPIRAKLGLLAVSLHDWFDPLLCNRCGHLPGAFVYATLCPTQLPLSW